MLHNLLKAPKECLALDFYNFKKNLIKEFISIILIIDHYSKII